jgi:MFS family permease
MSNDSPRTKVAGTALSTPNFLLLFAAMLVAAAGNTALQSVMPAIGREIGIADLWVALAYTSSAVLWVAFAPFWAAKSDRHGRKRLILLGLGGFIVSMALCGAVLVVGLKGAIGGAATFLLFALFRAIYGTLGCATPSATQAYLASRTRRSARVNALSALASSFGLGTIFGPALAPLFVLPGIGLPGPLFAFAIIGAATFAAILAWLPDDSRPGAGRRSGRGAAMSYPSIASPVTGASVVAATSSSSTAPPVKWRDSRIRRWVIAGVVSGHAQAASLTCIGFFVIDRLGIAPAGSEGPISIVMMGGAAAGLAAQWGLIPKLGMGPRALVLWGTLIAAIGLAIIILAGDLYGLVLGFAVSSLGFGFIRPGFTAGSSLAVSLAEQGSVAGVITAANGISFVAAPGIGMLLYGIDPRLPFAVSVVLLVLLAGWARARL